MQTSEFRRRQLSTNLSIRWLCVVCWLLGDLRRRGGCHASSSASASASSTTPVDANSANNGASCAFERVQTCLRGVLASMPDHHARLTVGCGQYGRLSGCLSRSNCSRAQAGEAGRRALAAVSGLQTPKELFLAVLNRWRMRCDFGCDEDGAPAGALDEECRERRIGDADLLAELRVTRLKLRAGVISSAVGCQAYRRSMLRWRDFRQSRCERRRAFCFCRAEEKRLRHVCALRCDQLVPSPALVSAVRSPVVDHRRAVLIAGLTVALFRLCPKVF